MADHLGVRAGATLSVPHRTGGPLVVTRLQGLLAPGVQTPPLKQEAAYSIVVQVRPLQHHDFIVGGRQVHTGAVPADAVSVVSLADCPRSVMSGPLDAVQFYVPHALVDAVARENDVPPPSHLAWPRADRDPVAAGLVTLLLPALAEPGPARAMFVEHTAMAFLAHALARYGGGAAPAARPVRSGLSPWQERRARDMMQARFGTALTIAEVARACKLSPSYFAAAFRRSTGQSPHRTLSDLRIAEAKRLMLGTGLPLAEVALLCGFGDQSYFTRAFSQAIGTSPGQWRRLNRQDGSAAHQAEDL
ncbi:AraC family transcriptional regulator [Methylobacterium currus]|uniref:helix-turn-helix domain-containing protein n=1 Tax=Methylobacterium currus TaxID=2051553 RepID=UPI001E3FF90C|nr:AraC family transcriptional regulator [Methylobacterium currus]UHC14965.1 AraC family transcriptional regulator [Methylobacterium currus]